MFCRSCGSPMSDGAKFCPKCGTQTAKSVQNAAQQTAQQPQSAAEKFRQSYQQGKQKGQQLFGNKSAKSARQAVPQQQYTQQQYAQPQYAQQPQYNAARQTAGAAGKKAAKSAAKAAAKTGAKTGLGFAAKAALVGAVGIAVVGGASTVLNNGDGGGGYKPPADPPGYEQTNTNPNGGENTYTNNPNSGGSENTGTYTGGGYTSAQEGQNFTRYWMQIAGFPTENGQPRLSGDFYIIERDAAAGKAYFWLDKREGEPNSTWDYDPNTGTISTPNDDTGFTLRMRLNPDGSLTDGATDIVEVENGSVREGAYVKLTGLTSEDGVNWTVPSTGETFKQDEFGNTTVMGGSNAMYEFEQEAIAWARANGVTLQYSEPEEEKPTYNPTPQPSMGKIDPPEDVLRYYVQVEAQHRISEQAGYPNGHVTLPENWNITQQQFDAMVEQEMRGQIMNP